MYALVAFVLIKLHARKILKVHVLKKEAISQEEYSSVLIASFAMSNFIILLYFYTGKTQGSV